MGGNSTPSSSPVQKPPKKPRYIPDGDGFIKPISVKRTRSNRIISQDEDFSSKNQFEILSDSEMSCSESETAPIPQTKNKRTINSQASPKSPKPIIVANTTFEIIKNSISSLALSEQPKIQKRRGGKDFAIFAESIGDKKIIIEKLKAVNQQHFTYTEVQDRHILFVLLGHYEVEVEDLKNSLNIAKIPATKVTKINRSVDDPIYLVSFEKNSITLSDLQYKHKVLNQLVIRWDKFKPLNRRPTQCRRCQRFGHAANNCALTYRCVKCTENHEPGKCSRISQDGLPSCVNCQSEGHTSNSTQCPVYMKHLETIAAKKKSPLKHPREFPATRYDWSTKQFPSIASQSSPSTSQPLIVNRNREYRPPLSQPIVGKSLLHEDTFSQIQNLQSELASIPDIKETIELFAKLVKDLKNAKSIPERLMVLVKYTGLTAQSSSSQQ